ncbi:hypothetical protein AAHE18_07G113500 [Arachis hypogaea]|nr:uncharacterized protein DS421_8g230850 [Arachis hypogaea]
MLTLLSQLLNHSQPSRTLHLSLCVARHNPTHQHNTRKTQKETTPRPSKLKVVKGRAREKSSPQAVATSIASLSVETMRGTSSATAKRLADFMTFVSIPGFKPPRKKDKPT